MPQSRPVRVIKRQQKQQIEKPAVVDKVKLVAERDRGMRDIISGWVREHRQRTDEFWQTYTTQLEEIGFQPRRPRTPSLS